MDNFDKLINRLNASKTSVQIAMAKGVERAGLLVQGDARWLVPVDTFRLKGSINTKVTETDNGAIAHVGTNVEYASYMEFGTGQRGETGNTEYPVPDKVHFKQDWLGVPPQPFLRPAFIFNRDSGNIRKVIQREVDKVLK